MSYTGVVMTLKLIDISFDICKSAFVRNLILYLSDFRVVTLSVFLCSHVADKLWGGWNTNALYFSH